MATLVLETTSTRWGARQVMMTLESCSARSLSFCCRGDLISSVWTMASLVLPMAVAVSVPMTTPLALPLARPHLLAGGAKGQDGQVRGQGGQVLEPCGVQPGSGAGIQGKAGLQDGAYLQGGAGLQGRAGPQDSADLWSGAGRQQKNRL